MRISHESPLEMLEESRCYNDYDYALVHLFEEASPAYLKFFEESVRLGRHVLLDNSLFELGTAFSIEAFAKWVKRLKPTEYIIPDVWQDKDATIYSIKRWNKEHSDLPGKTIGVLQGKSFEELIECYQVIEPMVDKVAISFGYDTFFSSCNELDYSPAERLMQGRLNFMKELHKVVNKKTPHHLLGTALPQEFTHYKHLSYIDTVDTSSPIVHGMLGIEYASWGLAEKAKGMLAHMLNQNVTQHQRNIIYRNIRLFKNFIR